MFAWIKISILKNFAFGAAFGGLLLTVFLWLIDLKGRGLVYDYIPELFAIFTGLVGAGLALAAAFYNADIQTELDRKARERKLLAARAMLPSALSGTATMAVKGIHLSIEYAKLEEDDRPEFAAKNAPNLQLDPTYLSIFREVVESTDDISLAERIALILREHQILLARWDSLSDDNGSILCETDDQLRSRVVHWAYLEVLVNSLFSYARNREVSILEADIESNLQISLMHADARIDEQDYVQEIKNLAQRHLKNTPP